MNAPTLLAEPRPTPSPQPTHPTPTRPPKQTISLRIGSQPRPVPDPDWPTHPPFPTGPGPQWAMGQPRPTGDDMPSPYPPPRPQVGWSIRIGRPPRLSRRQRTIRLLSRLGRYGLAWAVVGWACYWLADVHFSAAGFAIAAMLANPWRPKSAVRPVEHGLRAVCHSLLPRIRVARAGLLSAPSPRAT